MKPRAQRGGSSGGRGTTPGPFRDAEASRHMRNARALESQGRFREAAEAYRRAGVLQPRNVEALSRHALMLRQLGAFEASRDAFQRALRVDPRHVESHVFLAAVHKQLKDVGTALASYERAASLDPRETRAFTGKASIHEQLGELDEAEEAVRRALEIDPALPTARVLLARLRRRKGDHAAAVETLRRLLGETLPDETRFRAEFELSRNLERVGDHEGAWEAVGRANAIQARTPTSRAVDSRAWLRTLAEGLTFTADQFERWSRQEPGDDRRPPIFLIGFPRSGTTMTEQILSAHPDIGVSDEQNLFAPMYRALLPRYDERRPLPEQLDAISPQALAAGRRIYRERAEAILRGQGGASVFIDKNPMTIGAMGIVSRVFPDARVIVAQRDPRDVCLSCYFQEFIANPANVFFNTLAGTLEMYRRVMDVWLHQRPLLRLPILEWRYEDVTADFESQARRLLEFVGVPWDDGVLRFHERAGRRFVSTPSYEAVTAPVHTGARGRWRRYERQLAPILPALEPYVRALGYES